MKTDRVPEYEVAKGIRQVGSKTDLRALWCPKCGARISRDPSSNEKSTMYVCICGAKFNATRI